MRIIKLVIIMFFLLSNIAWPQTSKVGTTSAQFLKIGVGARAVAMGEANVGDASDITALFWNPAGLARLKHREAIFLHSQWLASLKFDFAGIVLPINEHIGNIAFFMTLLSTPEDLVRTVYYPQGTGETFQSIDLALGLSYAKYLTDQLSFGANLKYIRQSIWKMNGSSWAIDFGGMYQTQFRNFKVGLAISNFGPPIQFGGQSASLFVDTAPEFDGNRITKAELRTEAWELPLSFRFGIAFDLLQMQNSRFTFAGDVVNPNDNSEYADFGGEYAIREIVFLRVGYRGLGMDDLEGGLTAGAGISLNILSTRLRINYAFADYGRLLATHRYDLALTF